VSELPTILQIEITRNCNLKCIMCHKGQVPEGKDFDRTDISETVIEGVVPVYPYLRHAMLFGDGEPMVCNKFWKIMKDIREVGRQDCTIEFVCNGTLLNKKNIARCLDYRVSKICVSLGGSTPETHNKIRVGSDLNQIIENLEMFNKEKIKRKVQEPYISTSIVSMNSNIAELSDFVELCAKLNVWGVEVQKLHVTHSSMDKEVVTVSDEERYFKEAGKIEVDI